MVVLSGFIARWIYSTCLFYLCTTAHLTIFAFFIIILGVNNLLIRIHYVCQVINFFHLLIVQFDLLKIIVPERCGVLKETLHFLFIALLWVVIVKVAISHLVRWFSCLEFTFLLNNWSIHRAMLRRFAIIRVFIEVVLRLSVEFKSTFEFVGIRSLSCTHCLSIVLIIFKFHGCEISSWLRQQSTTDRDVEMKLWRWCWILQRMGILMISTVRRTHTLLLSIRISNILLGSLRGIWSVVGHHLENISYLVDLLSFSLAETKNMCMVKFLGSNHSECQHNFLNPLVFHVQILEARKHLRFINSLSARLLRGEKFIHGCIPWSEGGNKFILIFCEILQFF